MLVWRWYHCAEPLKSLPNGFFVLIVLCIFSQASCSDDIALSGYLWESLVNSKRRGRGRKALEFSWRDFKLALKFLTFQSRIYLCPNSFFLHLKTSPHLHPHLHNIDLSTEINAEYTSMSQCCLRRSSLLNVLLLPGQEPAWHLECAKTISVS